MELLERYLQAVRKYLPNRRQDDIVAELRANMESQIEDRESELGRPLTQGELEDFLRKMGAPVMVASRFQPQQFLIGPALFPLYLYVLRIAIAWASVIYCLVMAVVIPLTSPNATSVADALMRLPGVLINVAAWVTLVFAAFEFVRVRYPEKCPKIEGITEQWQPSSLPPLEKNADGAGKPRSYAMAVAEIIFGCLFLTWLMLIPRYPFLIFGPGAIYLKHQPFQLAPVWWTFFWWIVSLNALQIVWNSIDLARGAWRHPWRVKGIVFKVFGLIPLLILMSVRDHIYVLLKNPVDRAHYGQNVDQLNNGIHLALGVICAIIAVQLVWDLWQLAWDGYRRRGLPS